MKKRNKLWQTQTIPTNLKLYFAFYSYNQYKVNFPGAYVIKFIGYSIHIQYYSDWIDLYEKKK